MNPILLAQRRKHYSGIYTISSPSGNQYVGSAINFTRRWGKHLFDLRNQIHPNSILQKAFNKYGEANLKFSKIIICEAKDLLMYEQRAIEKLNPTYNICRIAGSSFGVKRTDECKAKLSLARKGISISETHRQKIIKAVTCPNARKINSETQKAIHGTPEMRLANSERQKVAQMRPEVRAKKGRALICVENGVKFTNGHEAAEWCQLAALTSNKNAFVAINKAVRTGKPIYGFHWKEIEKDIAK